MTEFIEKMLGYPVTVVSLTLFFILLIIKYKKPKGK